MSLGVVQASYAINTNDWERAYDLLKNESKSRPNVLSMFGLSCFLTARMEEGFETYKKLFSGNINSAELGCPLEKFDPFGKELYDALNYTISDMDLPHNINSNYKQSLERADETYSELDEYTSSVKAGQEKFEKFVYKVEEKMKVSDPEERGWAYFNAAETFFLKKDYEEAVWYYTQAIRSVPRKALFYGYATQAVLRLNNPNPIMAAIYARRAVELDPQNARWYMLLAISCQLLGARLQIDVSKVIQNELNIGLSKCRYDQISLRKAMAMHCKMFDCGN